MIAVLRFILTAVLLLAGLIVLAVGVLGQYRFKYALNRMHAVSMCDSLGLLCVLVGLSISCDDVWTIIKFALTVIFLWIASPTASHLIARLEATTNPNLEEEMEVTEK